MMPGVWTPLRKSYRAWGTTGDKKGRKLVLETNKQKHDKIPSLV